MASRGRWGVDMHEVHHAGPRMGGDGINPMGYGELTLEYFFLDQSLTAVLGTYWTVSWQGGSLVRPLQRQGLS